MPKKPEEEAPAEEKPAEEAPAEGEGAEEKPAEGEGTEEEGAKGEGAKGEGEKSEGAKAGGAKKDGDQNYLGIAKEIAQSGLLGVGTGFLPGIQEKQAHKDLMQNYEKKLMTMNFELKLLKDVIEDWYQLRITMKRALNKERYIGAKMDIIIDAIHGEKNQLNFVKIIRQQCIFFFTQIFKIKNCYQGIFKIH